MLKLLPYLLATYAHLVRLTSRTVLVNPEHLAAAKAMSEHQNYAMACWHQNLFCLILTGIQPFISMASQSKDGEVASRLAELMGIDCTRGSSSKGGGNASVQMIRHIKKTQWNCALTIDGPRGPAKIPKEGILKIAHKCNIPVLPYVPISSRHKVFAKSWDRFRLPLPFGRIYVGCGQPFMIEQADDTSLQQYAQQLIAESERVEAQILAMIQGNQ